MNLSNVVDPDKAGGLAPKQTICLIDGQFSATEAKEHLLGMIADNLAYHSLRSFSSQERFGQPDRYSKNKLDELETSWQQALNLLQLAKQSGADLKLEAEIKVTLV